MAETVSQLGQIAELLTNWLLFCVNIHIPRGQMTMNMSGAAFQSLPIIQGDMSWTRLNGEAGSAGEQYPDKPNRPTIIQTDVTRWLVGDLALKGMMKPERRHKSSTLSYLHWVSLGEV